MFKKDTSSMAHATTNNETIIAQGVKVEGDFHADGDVIIDGEVIGSIKTTRSLQIGATARIHANVFAATALIAGEVVGDIEAAERVELTATSQVKGDITTALISVAPGARINGKISMGGNETTKRGSRNAMREQEEVAEDVG